MAENNIEFVSDIEAKRGLIPIRLTGDKWNHITLHALPTNYAMLMMNIDYPDKAKDNPNGSLFMLPTKEILLNKSADIGLLYFGGKLNWNGIYNYHIKESYTFSNNDVFKYLNEIAFGTMTDDLDNGINGEEINLETSKRKELNTSDAFNGSPIDAIDKYITNSIPIIELLARAVAGKETAPLRDLLKLIANFNSVTEHNINEYLEKNNEVLKSIAQSSEKEAADRANANAKALNCINKIQQLLIGKNNTPFIQISNNSQAEFYKLLQELTSCDMDSISKLWKLHMNTVLHSMIYNGKIIYTEKDLDKVYNEFLNKTRGNNSNNSTNSNNSNNVSNSYQFDDYDYYILNEDYNDEYKQKLTQFDFDTIYKTIQSTISTKMIEVCSNKPEEWYIIQNAKTRMEKLKEACDKEINAKIELICRTVLNGTSSIGDKFKSAISKHPMRADGLKNIWAKYSDDLNDRIESRLRSITGDNGNSNILVTIKRFLQDTYPSLIAMLICWKTVFLLCQKYTNKYPTVIVNTKELKLLITNVELETATRNIQGFIIENNNE